MPGIQKPVTATAATRPTVLALHGFTLNGSMFSELAKLVNATVVAPDLPGHGGRDTTNTDWAQAVGEVGRVVRDTAPDLVLGYSMGGRIALAAALDDHAAFPRLVLVSTSLGIADRHRRAARRRADAARAAAIETGGLAAFLEEWGRQPQLQSPNSLLDLKAIRERSSAIGISSALHGMGQGAQPHLGHRLAGLPMPVVWVAGGHDHKYVQIAEQAAQACRAGTVEIVAGAFHNVVADRPDAIAAILAKQLSRQTA